MVTKRVGSIDRDPIVGVDRALERNVIEGDVSLRPVARRLKHEASAIPCGSPLCLGAPDERRIERCGRFREYRSGKIGANQSSPRLRYQRFIGEQVAPDAFKRFERRSCGAFDAVPGIRALPRPAVPQTAGHSTDITRAMILSVRS